MTLHVGQVSRDRGGLRSGDLLQAENASIGTVIENKGVVRAFL